MSTQHVNSTYPITFLLLTLCLILTLSACQPATSGPTLGITLEDPTDPKPETVLAVDTQRLSTPEATLEEPPLESPTDDKPETLTPTNTAQPPTPTPTPTPGLILEEYPLESPPDPDTRTFLPVGTSQEAVLAKHQTERERTVINQYFTIEGDPNPRTHSLGPGPKYTAILEESNSEPFRQTVTLLKEDEVIFSVDAGLPSPALPLQGLWSMVGTWVLEVYFVDENSAQGRVFQNGDFLNHSLGYQDVFGFQLLAGEPFYFFQGEDGLGYSYAGKETSLPYNEISHYNCCSAATLNPIQAENMVAFFALIGDDWYYVELGIFNSE